MTDVTALVLAGGKSSRMGCDKLLLELNGLTMLEGACAFARTLTDKVLVAAGSKTHFNALPEGCRAVYDETPGLGPLGGLCAGLGAAETEYVLVFAGDMPNLSPEAAAQLYAAIGSADICLFQKDGRPEPLFALYRRRVLPAAQIALKSGQLQLAALIGSLDARILDWDTDTLFTNLNTPEDYESACRQVEPNE